jgi:hypothetical protein
MYLKFFRLTVLKLRFFKSTFVRSKNALTRGSGRWLNLYAVRASFFRVPTLKKFDCGHWADLGLIRCGGPRPHINVRFHCSLFIKELAAEDISISNGPTAYSKGASRGPRSSSVGTPRLYQKDELRTVE